MVAPRALDFRPRGTKTLTRLWLRDQRIVIMGPRHFFLTVQCLCRARSNKRVPVNIILVLALPWTEHYNITRGGLQEMILQDALHACYRNRSWGRAGRPDGSLCLLRPCTDDTTKSEPKGGTTREILPEHRFINDLTILNTAPHDPQA